MAVTDLNPGAMIGDQLRGQWQTLCAMLVWKLAREGVTLTVKDMEEFQRQNDCGEAVFYFRGHPTSIDFRIVDRDHALQIAEHERTQQGRA